MKVLTALLFTHIFADFTLQTDWIAENKRELRVAFWSHIAIHTAVSFISLTLVSKPSIALIGAAIYGAAHYAIDSHQPRPKINIDQTLHLISIILIWGILTGITIYI